jgi:hypothetical protein
VSFLKLKERKLTFPEFAATNFGSPLPEDNKIGASA